MMATRKILADISANLEESMGVRAVESRTPLSPMPRQRDAGRRPNLQFGKVRIDQVVPDPKQPRVQFSEEALDRLAGSIREKGQLTPIRVRWDDEYAKWVIVFGERRWRAALKADLTEIDCHFSETDLTPAEILEQQLIENCLREDLQPVEEGRAFASLMEVNGWNAKELSEALRLHPSRVSRALSLLRLPPEIQESVDQGEVSARAGYELSRLENPQTQQELAEQLTAGAVTGEEASRAVRQRQGKSKRTPGGTRQVFVTEDGWRVQVTARRRGSYHEIERALCEALEEVRHRIQVGRECW